MRRAALLLAVLLAGCGGGGGAAKGPFAYDRGAPLAFRDAGVVATGPVTVHNVSYAGADGRRIEAFLVVPPAGGRYPAVVWLHGSGGSRNDFLVDAAELAKRGAVTMTLTLPPARTYRPLVVDVERALDLLAARPDVDRKRMGVVGYSMGAQVAAIAAGVDPRVEAAGIISGRGTDMAKRYVAEAKGRLFFQMGIDDTVVPPPELQALADAAPKARRIARWYPGGHEPSRRALADERAFQARTLGIGTAPASG